jgi:hypothetical protein
MKKIGMEYDEGQGGHGVVSQEYCRKAGNATSSAPG